jgi:hypothetical protein
MKFLFAVNLTEKTLHTGIQPWDFQPTEEITAQIRGDKEARQQWYANSATKHYFYTLIEGANPNQRPSKENPPQWLHGISADYDVKIPPERVLEAVKAMKIKPAYVERSLGGNVRLVWLFSKPLPIDGCDFCSFILTSAIKWLTLDMLPGLDEPSVVAFSRLLCNGCDWSATTHGPVPENEVQAFFVKCGREFRFQPATDGNEIPLDLVEKELQTRFPNFSWPSDFTLDSQGPSFWVDGSTSPMSAIVKKDGMFTFSGHAGKPFFSWAEIIGSEFVKKFATDSIARATDDIWWDSKRFWRKKSGFYVALDMPELRNYFKVACRISEKPGKDGVAPVDTALDAIYNNGSITGAAPFVFRPSGLITYKGHRVLNTWDNKVVKPSDEITPWGPDGKFPFLSMWLDNIFDPKDQLPFFMAWWKYYYTSAYTCTPMPGQVCFLMGGANIGKTVLNRHVVGYSVGGFTDAADYLVQTGGFNSEMFETPHWAVDDETLGESTLRQATFHAMLKKASANQEFKANKKYGIPTMCEWMGRVFITCNLDYVSSRALGSMDNTSADKTNVFKCVSESAIVFPSRPVFAEIIHRELPYLLRWMLNWEPPDFVIRDVRFGYASHHDKTLVDQAHQGGKGAPFKELLVEALQNWFAGEGKAQTEWRGTLVQLQRLLIIAPGNEFVLRSLRLEQTNRYLEMIQREGILKCKTETGSMKTRVWVFYRFGDLQPTEPINIPPTTNNPFNKNAIQQSEQAGL